jgi:hypothetical protein
MMLSAAFHARGWNRPNLGLKIDFIPTGAEDFARSPCRQNKKFESHRGKPRPFAKSR